MTVGKQERGGVGDAVAWSAPFRLERISPRHVRLVAGCYYSFEFSYRAVTGCTVSCPLAPEAQAGFQSFSVVLATSAGNARGRWL